MFASLIRMNKKEITPQKTEVAVRILCGCIVESHRNTSVRVQSCVFGLCNIVVFIEIISKHEFKEIYSYICYGICDWVFCTQFS